MLKNFGKYRIICEVGRGGMGIIYEGHDDSLNRSVAIKQLILEHTDPEKKDEFRERFRREACLAAGVSHPNLISIYDVSISTDNSYYVMEFLKGQSLRSLIDQSPGRKIRADNLLPIFKQTCAGLSHAHDMTLVHRDIKPDNIFILANGKVKITDFGIAKSIREGENSMLTKPGVMLGTLAYSSPEQVRDAHKVDQRADIYSLGVVVYEALCGQVPFAGDLTSTLMAIVSKEPKTANEINPEVSADIAAVIAKAMRKIAEDRYPSVSEFEKEFERAMGLSRAGGSTSGGMLRPTGSPSGSYTPGIPVVSSGKFTPAAGLRVPVVGAGGNTTSSADLSPKQVVKPWLSGRTGEQNKPTTSELQSITKPAAFVRVAGQIGRAGNGPGTFQEPAAICVRAGKIVVADTSRRDFQVFAIDGLLQAESRPNPNSKTGSNLWRSFFEAVECSY